MAEIQGRSAPLLDEASGPNGLSHAAPPPPHAGELAPTATVSPRQTSTASAANGRPLQVAIFLLYQDPDNPRTEFAEEKIDDLARDIRERGILQPIVVHSADAAGRYRIHFGETDLVVAQAGLQVQAQGLSNTAHRDSVRGHRLHPKYGEPMPGSVNHLRAPPVVHDHAETASTIRLKCRPRSR
jgi:hypothetical protein